MRLKDPHATRLSPTQLRALRYVRDKQVPIQLFSDIPAKGSPVNRTTLWALLDRKLVKVHGWYASGKADIRLTAFGKQVLDWSEKLPRG